MKNEYIEKINKLGHTGLVISKIVKVMVSIAMVALLVSSVLLMLVPKNSITVTTSHNAEITMDMSHSIIPSLVSFDANSNFELNGVIYDHFKTENNLAVQTATATSTPHTFAIKDMMWGMLAGAVMCALLQVAIKKVTALFALLNDCETPFTQQTANCFKSLAVSFVPVYIMALVCEGIMEYIVNGMFNLTINLLTIAAPVLILLMMAEIFRYGAMLQIESDETL